jgi:phage terminase large subunit
MGFEVTTAVRKMLAMTQPIKVVQGATSSGKTYGIVPIIIDKCLEKPRTKATVVAESIPAVKDGAVQIFKDFMHDEGRWRDEQWLGNPMEYTFRNGSQIQFKSFDSFGKAKAAGKRDILFLNEGNHIHYDIADALMIRSSEVWIDFNADSEFWAHTEVLKQPFAEFLKLTYLDNEAIPDATLQKMLYRKQLAEAEDKAGMRGYWWNWFQVYGLGEVGSLLGAVFTNWQECSHIPENAEYLGTGLDFGYTNDPTAAVDVFRYDGELYLDEVIYRKGLSNSELAGLLKGKKVVADSAEPKSIAEIQSYGVSIKGATKGKDSINYGISVLQEFRLNVTARSTNLKEELRSYTWKTDRNGKSLNEPIDVNNHCLDGVRYLAMDKLGVKKYTSILTSLK